MLGHGERVISGANLRDDFHVGFAVEDSTDPETHEGSGFDEDDPDGLEVRRR
jgi:hypothetical protein